jgi:serine/threonine protein kinase
MPPSFRNAALYIKEPVHIGRGKYSLVYAATYAPLSFTSNSSATSSPSRSTPTITKHHSTPSDQLVIKLFKPAKSSKFKREVLILKHVSGGPHMPCFIDAIMESEVKKFLSDWVFRVEFYLMYFFRRVVLPSS